MDGSVRVDGDDLRNCRVRALGTLRVPDPAFGDFRLNVFPVHHGEAVRLPRGFELWEETVNLVLNHIPVQPSALRFYVTIDSRFFSQEETLRRPGVHLDGNFCADPDFAPRSTWGPAPAPTPKPTWGGMVCVSPVEKPDNSHVRMAWKLPYDIVIPVGTYVSSTKGGLVSVSSLDGCNAWPGRYDGVTVGSGGDLEEARKLGKITLGAPTPLRADTLYVLTSNTPHESLPVPVGSRRTMIRVTLDHRYENRVLFEDR